MDNLARDCLLARQAGTSYGKWKAAQDPSTKKRTIPDGWKQCKGCGKAFKPRSSNHVYCDMSCRYFYTTEAKL